jgi:hypothetical protein
MVSAFDEVPLNLSLFIFLSSSHVYSFVLVYFKTFLLGVFAELQKVTFSFVMSVHMFFSLFLTAGNSIDPTGWIFINFNQTWDCTKSIEKISCLIKI